VPAARSEAPTAYVRPRELSRTRAPRDDDQRRRDGSGPRGRLVNVPPCGDHPADDAVPAQHGGASRQLVEPSPSRALVDVRRALVEGVDRRDGVRGRPPRARTRHARGGRPAARAAWPRSIAAAFTSTPATRATGQPARHRTASNTKPVRVPEVQQVEGSGCALSSLAEFCRRWPPRGYSNPKCGASSVSASALPSPSPWPSRPSRRPRRQPGRCRTPRRLPRRRSTATGWRRPSEREERCSSS